MRHKLQQPWLIETFGSLEEITAVAREFHKLFRPEEEKWYLESALEHVRRLGQKATRMNMGEVSLSAFDRLYIYYNGSEFYLNYNQRSALSIPELYEKALTAFKQAWKKAEQ
jgi:hypothetical protein